MIRILNYLKSLFSGKKKPTYGIGWVKDDYDPRDVKFKVTIPVQLPPMVDLRPQCPPVYNQGTLGSCTANALGAAFQFEQMKQNKPNFIPSRLFIYYNERAMEGTINQDNGAMIRDGIKTMVKDGVCPEPMWVYDINKFRVKPHPNCYVEAEKNQVLEYLRLSPHTLYDVKYCLADGYPVVFGFMIYESLYKPEVARTGFVPMPKPRERFMGGHAVMAVGYDDEKEALIVRNSWGTGWGLNGYFYLPYGYVTESHLSADYWTIRLVE